MSKAMLSLGSFSITPTETQSFASIAGDYNPLHFDLVVAHNSRFSTTLIHGIHGTLKALDIFFTNHKQSISLTSLQVEFNKPVSQEDAIECLVENTAPESVRIKLQSHGKTTQSIEFSFLPGVHLDAALAASSICDMAELPKPNEITLDQADGLRGSVALDWHPVQFTELFPQLARKLPDAQCATILGTSKLVGMVCPGLNALYARLNLTFVTNSREPSALLDYNVTNTDERFSLLVMDVSSRTAAGKIEALIRPSVE